MAMFRFLPYCFAIRHLGELFGDIVSDCEAKSVRRVGSPPQNRFFKLQARLVRSKWTPDQAKELQNRTSVARIEGKRNPCGVRPG